MILRLSCGQWVRFSYANRPIVEYGTSQDILVNVLSGNCTGESVFNGVNYVLVIKVCPLAMPFQNNIRLFPNVGPTPHRDGGTMRLFKGGN